MSKIILSEIKLDSAKFAVPNIEVCSVTEKSLHKYEGNTEVIGIVGCRATAKRAIQMDFPGLKLYQLTSAGFDGIPVRAFSQKNVWLCNAGDVYSTPIAETVIYGMLQYAKRYWKNPKWHVLRPMRGYRYIQELSGKSLLIMGCGRIGTEVAVRAKAFEMTICGYDPYVQSKEGYEEIFATREELIQNLKRFDYIVTTIPLAEETEGFLNSELFYAMDSNAVIINVGRTGIFNKRDLLCALRKKTIRGAVMDMFEPVPNPITNPFRRLPNVIVLPGVSAISVQVKERLKKHVIANVSRVLQGDLPSNVVS